MHDVVTPMFWWNLLAYGKTMDDGYVGDFGMSFIISNFTSNYDCLYLVMEFNWGMSCYLVE